MSASSPSSLSGRLWLAGIGLFLALAGVAFTWMLWTAWQRAEEHGAGRRCPAASCRHDCIKSDRHRTQNPTYRAEVRYSFSFAGKAMTGTHIKRVDSASQHEDVAREGRS